MSVPTGTGTTHLTIENPAVDPQPDYSLGKLTLQVDLEKLQWLSALAAGQPDPYAFLSEFFDGVTFGLMLGPAYELSLILTPQPGRYAAFVCHVETPPDDMDMSRAALRIEAAKPVEMSESNWLLLPKVEFASISFVALGKDAVEAGKPAVDPAGKQAAGPAGKRAVEWSQELAKWYRSFRVPGTPGAATVGAGEDASTFTPVEVTSHARTFLEQVDTVLDVLQTAREKRAHELRRKATVAESALTCPVCHQEVPAGSRACPECGRSLGPAYQQPGAVTEALLELPPGQAERFNSFQKLELMTAAGEMEPAFDVVDRSHLRVYFRRPVQLLPEVEIAPIEGGAVASAQRHALDLALSGHPDLATVIKLVAAPERMPEPGDSPLPNPLFNAGIDDNEEQKEAVRRIVALPAGGLMMLQGPPGTGKTTVIVEAVRQILAAKPMARILISSHSNRAVDDATERLQKHGVRIFRLKAGEDRGVTTWDRAGDERVVAATCNKAVVTEGQRGEQYTYAFLDEANKARAEETIPFIALGQRVVLIGDHHQLPPVVEEEDLAGLRRGTPEWHLARKSYFEILWESDLPATDKIRLEVQHRMHPAIRHLVSQRFYRGSLRDGDVVKAYHRPKVLGAHRSLIWIDSAGAEVREMRTGNGSIYNLNHVNICRSLVRLLSERTDPSLNIALIGMYREQLRRYGQWRQWTHRDFRADTVDAFEGAEADVVIVDLVRSNPRGMVGFLEVHNRINVAMSRAKRLLIVVGDSQTVRSNRVLRQVFEGFRRSGAIVPWHRLPNVGKGSGKRRRRRGQPEGQRPEGQPRQRQQGPRQPGQRVAVPADEIGEGMAPPPPPQAPQPRRIRLRPLPGGREQSGPTGADAPEEAAEGAPAMELLAPGQQPAVPGQSRRSRRRRRRRQRNRQPGEIGTEAPTPADGSVPTGAAAAAGGGGLEPVAAVEVGPNGSAAEAPAPKPRARRTAKAMAAPDDAGQAPADA